MSSIWFQTEILKGLLAVGALFAPGYAFFRIILPEPQRRLLLLSEHITFCAALGMLAWSMVLVLLGVANLLYADLIFALTVGALVWGVGLMLWKRHFWLAKFRSLRHTGPTAMLITAAIVVAFYLLFLDVLTKAAIHGDSVRYQMAFARQLLLHHGFRINPGIQYEGTWMSVNLLHTLAMDPAHPTQTIPFKVFNFFFGPYLAIATYALARKLGSNALYAVATSGLLFSAFYMGFMGNTKDDIAVAFICVSAALAICLLVAPNSSWAGVVGLLMGFGLTCKFSSLPFLVPLGLALVFLWRVNPRMIFVILAF